MPLGGFWTASHSSSSSFITTKQLILQSTCFCCCRCFVFASYLLLPLLSFFCSSMFLGLDHLPANDTLTARK